MSAREWLRFFQRKRREDDFAAEAQAYLEEETARNLEAGMDLKEAFAAARRKFGNATAIREIDRDMNTLGFFESFWQDLSYGARQLRSNPGFFVVAVLSLALGIGANTAIFHLLDALRLRSLPVENAQQLAEVRIAENEHCCNGNFTARHSDLTYPLWEQIRNRQQVFSSIFAFGDNRFNIGTGGEVRYVEGLWVSGQFFSALGVRPELGRFLTADDDRPGCTGPGVVLSHAFWQHNYAGAPAVLGSNISIEGHPLPIVGVAPPYFYGVEVGKRFDVAVPVCAEPLIAGEESHLAKRHHWWLAAIGRLKPGVSVAQATAQLQTISPAVFQETVPPNYTAEMQKYYAGYKLESRAAASGVSNLRHDYVNPLWILLAIAGLVLLIACANLANLLLARAAAREHEIAVRLAIGASRGRIIRQLLAESLLLAFIGAAAGAGLARWLSRYMVGLLTTTNNPLFIDLNVGWRVFGFIAMMAVVTCLLFGLVPALRATRMGTGAALKGSSRSTTAGRERNGLRRGLVVSQIALSLVLVFAALLFSRSFVNLITAEAGFRAGGVLITAIDASRANLTPERRGILYRDLLARIRSIPGVEAAATASIIPVSGNRWNDRIDLLDGKHSASVISDFSRVSPQYFQTLGTPLLAGRDFTDRDNLSSPSVAVVNEAFSRKFLGGGSPIGLQIRIVTGPGEPPASFQIVGLTKDAKYISLRAEFEPTVFVSETQNRRPEPGIRYLVRASGSAGPLFAELKKIVSEENSSLIVWDFETFETRIKESLILERLMATLSGFFGVLAAVLATIGLYGVISYMVARRRGEIGIRMALGADRSQVVRLILSEASVLVLVGCGLGLLLSIFASRSASAILYGLRPYDPVTLAAALVLLVTVSLVASFIPATRASRLQPMTALREE
ncbi:MAG: ABC transporter permease [Bryobacteraceae bacterium]